MRTTIYPIMKSRILTLLMFVSFAFSAFAYDFEVGDFQYNIINLSDRTAEIVGTTNNECEQVNIPSEVMFNGMDIHVISIGQNVFSKNKKLKEVVVGDGIRNINKSFYACEKLNKVELGTATDSLIGAFEYCDSLREVTFKSASCYVSRWAFHGCEKLSVINIPSVNTWCSYRFEDCLFHDLKEDVFLYVQGKPIISVALPDGLTHIGNYQFAGLRTIKEMKLPQTIKVIGEGAFAGINVKDISIPEECDSILDQAFEGLHLEKLIIPANVKYLGQLGGGYYAYYGATIGKLIFEETTDSITINHTHVTGNNSYAQPSDFMDGMSINEIQLRRPIKGLFYTYYYKSNPNSTAMKKAYSDSYSSAFYKNKTLNKIVIGRYFRELSARTFSGCSNIDSLIIEDTDEPITFSQDCTYLEEEKSNPSFYDEKPYYRSEFGESPLKYVYIGRNIIYKEIAVDYWSPYKYTGVRPSPFASKCMVKEITIGNNVTSLPDNNLFKNCPIEIVCIGERLNEIPEGTFSHTENSLKTITLHNETPPTYISGFSNYDYVNCKLFVPRSAMDSYKPSEPWGKFWNINDLETTSIDSITTKKDLSKNHIYSINGTKVTTPSNGIYIINGKKVLYK